MGSRGRWLVVLIGFAMGCQPVEPVGAAPTRVADQELIVERWFAEPGVREYVVTRGADGERTLRSLDGEVTCVLGQQWVRWVVSSGPVDARVIRLVLSSLDHTALEVRDLECAQVGETIGGLTSMSQLFVDGRTFGALASQNTGQLLRIDLFAGTSAALGLTGGFGLSRTITGKFEAGTDWIDLAAEPAAPPRLWNLEAGQIVVSTLGGETIGRAGQGVRWVERVEAGATVLWFNDPEGLWRWEPDGGQPELLVEEGCSFSGVDPFYVRIPCGTTDLFSVDASTLEIRLFATNVVSYAAGANGQISYSTNVDGELRSFVAIPGVSFVEVPPGAWIIDQREGSRLLYLDGVIEERFDDGRRVEVLAGLRQSPRLLSDGQLLALHGEGPTGTLSTVDPDTLAVETLAEGVPDWGLITPSYSLSGRSLLLFLTAYDVERSAGKLEAMVWPTGPRVVVAEGVSSFAQALYAEPPTLFFTRAGDDPGLWLVPL